MTRHQCHRFQPKGTTLIIQKAPTPTRVPHIDPKPAYSAISIRVFKITHFELNVKTTCIHLSNGDRVHSWFWQSLILERCPTACCNAGAQDQGIAIGPADPAHLPYRYVQRGCSESAATKTDHRGIRHRIRVLHGRDGHHVRMYSRRPAQAAPCKRNCRSRPRCKPA